MIASLKGNIVQKNEKSCVIDVNGVGYYVFATKSFLSQKNIGDLCECFIRTIVREDSFSLYGFGSLEDQSFFDLLLTVTRVGPKMALEILNASASRVKQVILKKDIAFLSRIPGVGKKTAERIVLELLDKIKMDSLYLKEETSSLEDADIVDALQKLGYQRNHISRVLRDKPKELTKEEDIIKYFLQHI